MLLEGKIRHESKRIAGSKTDLFDSEEDQIVNVSRPCKILNISADHLSASVFYFGSLSPVVPRYYFSLIQVVLV